MLPNIKQVIDEWNFHVFKRTHLSVDKNISGINVYYGRKQRKRIYPTQDTIDSATDRTNDLDIDQNQ